jgi:DNA-binding XRE family transcriptional regulator
MAHKWRDIRRTLSPEQEEATRQYVKSVVEAVTLNQLREARSLTQANLASVLGVNQGSVSKMEKRTDMYISTLRSFIQAMGGQLQIKAVFPEGEVEIEQFKDVAAAPVEAELGAGSRQETAA